jgi:hypothetical protein
MSRKRLSRRRSRSRRRAKLSVRLSVRRTSRRRSRSRRRAKLSVRRTSRRRSRSRRRAKLSVRRTSRRRSRSRRRAKRSVRRTSRRRSRSRRRAKRTSRRRSRSRRRVRRTSRRRSRSRRRAKRSVRSTSRRRSRSRAKFGFWNKKHYLCTYGDGNVGCKEFPSKSKCESLLKNRPDLKKIGLQCYSDKRACLIGCRAFANQGAQDSIAKSKYKANKQSLYNQKLLDARTVADAKFAKGKAHRNNDVMYKRLKEKSKTGKLSQNDLNSFSKLAEMRRKRAANPYKEVVYNELWWTDGKTKRCKRSKKIGRTKVEQYKIKGYRFYPTKEKCIRNL